MKFTLRRITFRSFRGFITDLIVVFVGVFLAFQLSDYKDNRAARKARLNYYQSFKDELLRVGVSIRQVADSIDHTITHYETEIAAGHKPKLVYHRSYHFPAKAYVVESAFNDQNFSTIGREFIVSISAGSNFFSWIDYELKTYNERVKDLLYNKPYHESQFYALNGELKEEYKWYLADLKVIRQLLNHFNEEIYSGAIPATNKLIESME